MTGSGVSTEELSAVGGDLADLLLPRVVDWTPGRARMQQQIEALR